MYFRRFAEDLERPSQPPQVLYHQAPVEARESIRKHGLLLDYSRALDNAIFFSSKPKPQPGFDVWEVDTQGMELEEDWTTTPDDEADMWWIAYQDVPPNKLRLAHITENRQLGRSLPEIDPARYGHRNAKVTIYRGTTIDIATFRPKDYVTLNYKFARDHAKHTAEIEEEPAHVLSARVLASEVFEAYNPGEFFYDGPETPGRPILEVQPTALESNFVESVNLQGEYWITEDGDVHYADGDIGDYNHEAHVIEAIQSQLADEFGVWVNPPYDWDEIKKQFVQEILDSTDESQREELEEIGEYDPDELIELYLTQEGHQNAQELLSLANGGGDAREYAIKNWGWKRVAGMSVETWTLTPQDMKAISRGMEEIIEQEDPMAHDVPDEQIEIDISVYHQGNRIDATLAELKRGQLGNTSQSIPSSAYTSDDWSHSASQQVRDVEIGSMHPAYWPSQPPHKNPYGRKGVNPFGDWLIRRGKRLAEAAAPDLSYLLEKPGKIPQIGPESVTRSTTDGISVYRSPHGSVRYVYIKESQPVAALQVVTMDNESASVANVWTDPDHRRQGLASELLNAAKKDFTTVKHHDDVTDTELSDDGKQWKSSFSEDQ